jgi:hypothetical protein
MIRGFVEAIAANGVTGWACADDAPTVRLAVRVRVGDRELGHTEAKIPRPDLRGHWNDNDGAHGFTLSFAGALELSQLADVRVDVARPGSEMWDALPLYVQRQPMTEGTVAAAMGQAFERMKDTVERMEVAVRRAEDAARRAEDAARRAKPSSEAGRDFPSSGRTIPTARTPPAKTVIRCSSSGRHDRVPAPCAWRWCAGPGIGVSTRAICSI